MVTYQFRLYPTKKQARAIDVQIEQHRLLYNKCLELKIKTYEEFKTNLTCFDLIKSEVPKFKDGCNYSSLQQTVRRLDKTYQAFFRKQNKFPRFKAKNRFRTIEYCKHGDGCKLKDSMVYLQHIGNIQCGFHRAYDKPKTLSITKSNKTYYVNVMCDNIIPINSMKLPAIGIDFGIKSTVTDSEGNKTETPQYTKSKLKEIKKLSTHKKYKALNHVYAKIKNQRKDFNHKLSRQIVDKFNIICLEDLKVKKILSHKHVNRRISDIAINQLIQFITYKAENAGKHIVMVNPAYTTQTCSECGIIKPKTLKQRKHSCSCGYKTDRDTNAARNILRLGLQSLGVNP